MALKVKVITLTGFKNEGVYYLHEQAFTKAISLEKVFEVPIIEEHQWDASTNSLITKHYFVRNKAVYTKDDAINPIYSFLAEHSSISFYRKIVYAMCKKAVKIYDFYKTPSPYNDEYIYSLSLLELKALETKITEDNNIYRFNKDVEFITKGILETSKVLNIGIPDFYSKIISLDASEMMEYILTIEKGLKFHLLKNVYGLSYVPNF
jgi:hypothetical protein